MPHHVNSIGTPASLGLNQMLHGYSEGHRLLESSIKLPDDQARLVLRMSDLSGTSIVQGFDEYVTGYPLLPTRSYALAKTWYAPEMPRPGCVWTHTLVIPEDVLAESPSLGPLMQLFKRPSKGRPPGDYLKPIEFDALEPEDREYQISEPPSKLADIIWSLYSQPETPIIISARSAKEFEETCLTIWSQQWPALRRHFAFCTGALSARSIPGRMFDAQCVPSALARQVLTESSTPANSPPPTLAGQAPDDAAWVQQAVSDAQRVEGGDFRQFLWETAEDSSRNSFQPLASLFTWLASDPSLSDVILKVQELFPEPSTGSLVKNKLFGEPSARLPIHGYDEGQILALLGSTDHYKSFDAEKLRLRDRGRNLCGSEPEAAQTLIAELFRSRVNPIGEEILAGLIAGIGPDLARKVTRDQPRFLPALFRAKPELAMLPELWSAASDRARELFESVAAHATPGIETVRGIVQAMLQSGSDNFLQRAFDKWGTAAVFAALDWIAANKGNMTETCRGALTFHVPDVMDWVASEPEKPTHARVAAAHVVAPYAYQIADRDTSVFHRTLHELQKESAAQEEFYFSALLLALAFSNAPPKPMALVAECFEFVHDVAGRDRLKDEAWIALDPIVPHLWWLNDWDKCERLRRGLLQAFVRHKWPPSEIRSCVKSSDILKELRWSTYHVDGATTYFRDIL